MIIASNLPGIVRAVREYANNLGLEACPIDECDDQAMIPCDYAVNIGSELVQVYSDDPVGFIKELYEELFLIERHQHFDSVLWRRRSHFATEEVSHRSLGRLEIWIN